MLHPFVDCLHLKWISVKADGNDTSNIGTSKSKVKGAPTNYPAIRDAKVLPPACIAGPSDSTGPSRREIRSATNTTSAWNHATLFRWTRMNITITTVGTSMANTANITVNTNMASATAKRNATKNANTKGIAVLNHVKTNDEPAYVKRNNCAANG